VRSTIILHGLLERKRPQHAHIKDSAATSKRPLSERREIETEEEKDSVRGLYQASITAQCAAMFCRAKQ
jgi:hypothetical protein